jgi:hypothetical protein
MNPSFDALNKSITQPNRIRSRAFPTAPAMMKANPRVVRRAVARRSTTRTRRDATTRFSVVSPQRVSSPDTGTRPNALLLLNTRVRSTGPGKIRVDPTFPSAESAHCFESWSMISTSATTDDAMTRDFGLRLTSEPCVDHGLERVIAEDICQDLRLAILHPSCQFSSVNVTRRRRLCAQRDRQQWVDSGPSRMHAPMTPSAPRAAKVGARTPTP